MIKYMIVFLLIVGNASLAKEYNLSSVDSVQIAQLELNYSDNPVAAEKLLKAQESVSDQIWFHLAGMYSKQESWHDAKRLLEEILVQKPDWFSARNNLVAVLMSLKLYKSAIPHISYLLDSSYEKKSSMREQLAYSLLQSQYFVAAITAYQTALQYNPIDNSLNRGLISAYFNAGELGKASTLSLEILDREPLDHELWLTVVHAALQNNDNEEAFELLYSAYSLSLLNSKEKVMLVQLAIDLEVVESVAYVIGEIDVDALSVREVLNCSFALVESGNREKASILLSALHVKSDNSEYVRYCELVASCSVNQDKAILFLERASSADPLNPSILYKLGDLYSENDRDTEAEWLFNRVIEIKGDYHLHALVRLSSIYKKQKKYDLVIKVLQQLLALNSSDAVKRYADALKSSI